MQYFATYYHLDMEELFKLYRALYDSYINTCGDVAMRTFPKNNYLDSLLNKIKVLESKSKLSNRQRLDATVKNLMRSEEGISEINRMILASEFLFKKNGCAMVVSTNFKQLLNSIFGDSLINLDASTKLDASKENRDDTMRIIKGKVDNDTLLAAWGKLIAMLLIEYSSQYGCNISAKVSNSNTKIPFNEYPSKSDQKNDSTNISMEDILNKKSQPRQKYSKSQDAYPFIDVETSPVYTPPEELLQDMNEDVASMIREISKNLSSQSKSHEQLTKEMFSLLRGLSIDKILVDDLAISYNKMNRNWDDASENFHSSFFGKESSLLMQRFIKETKNSENVLTKLMKNIERDAKNYIEKKTGIPVKEVFQERKNNEAESLANAIYPLISSKDNESEYRKNAQELINGDLKRNKEAIEGMLHSTFEKAKITALKFHNSMISDLINKGKRSPSDSFVKKFQDLFDEIIRRIELDIKINISNPTRNHYEEDSEDEDELEDVSRSRYQSSFNSNFVSLFSGWKIIFFVLFIASRLMGSTFATVTTDNIGDGNNTMPSINATSVPLSDSSGSTIWDQYMDKEHFIRNVQERNRKLFDLSELKDFKVDKVSFKENIETSNDIIEQNQGVYSSVINNSTLTYAADDQSYMKTLFEIRNDYITQCNKTREVLIDATDGSLENINKVNDLMNTLVNTHDTKFTEKKIVEIVSSQLAEMFKSDVQILKQIDHLKDRFTDLMKEIGDRSILAGLYNLHIVSKLKVTAEKGLLGGYFEESSKIISKGISSDYRYNVYGESSVSSFVNQKKFDTSDKKGDLGGSIVSPERAYSMYEMLYSPTYEIAPAYDNNTDIIRDAVLTRLNETFGGEEGLKSLLSDSNSKSTINLMIESFVRNRKYHQEMRFQIASLGDIIISKLDANASETMIQCKDKLIETGMASNLLMHYTSDRSKGLNDYEKCFSVETSLLMHEESFNNSKSVIEKFSTRRGAFIKSESFQPLWLETSSNPIESIDDMYDPWNILKAMMTVLPTGPALSSAHELYTDLLIAKPARGEIAACLIVKIVSTMTQFFQWKQSIRLVRFIQWIIRLFSKKGEEFNNFARSTNRNATQSDVQRFVTQINTVMSKDEFEETNRKINDPKNDNDRNSLIDYLDLLIKYSGLVIIASKLIDILVLGTSSAAYELLRIYWEQTSPFYQVTIGVAMVGTVFISLKSGGITFPAKLLTCMESIVGGFYNRTMQFVETLAECNVIDGILWIPKKLSLSLVSEETKNSIACRRMIIGAEMFFYNFFLTDMAVPFALGYLVNNRLIDLEYLLKRAMRFNGDHGAMTLLNDIRIHGKLTKDILKNFGGAELDVISMSLKRTIFDKTQDILREKVDIARNATQLAAIGRLDPKLTDLYNQNVEKVAEIVKGYRQYASLYIKARDRIFNLEKIQNIMDLSNFVKEITTPK